MKTKVIVPKDKSDWLRLRSEDVTSTEVSALFGVSPYATEFELWHRKKSGDVVEFVDNERVRWGSRLEKSIAAGIAEDKSWEVEEKKHYMRRLDLRAGSSFDFEIKEPRAILEIKNVDGLVFKENWEVSGEDIQAPLHIELQVQHQLMVSELERAFIGALVGGNRVVLIERVRDDSVIKGIEQKVMAFWESIEGNKEPKPDFERDAKFISSLRNTTTKGKVYESDSVTDDLWAQYDAASRAESEAKKLKEAYKAQILMAIGDAEKLQGDGWSISCGIVEGGPVSFVKRPFRDFKPYRKKGVNHDDKD